MGSKLGEAIRLNSALEVASLWMIENRGFANTAERRFGRRIPLYFLALADGAVAPETCVGCSEPTLPLIRGDSVHLRASFSPRLGGSAGRNCRIFVIMAGGILKRLVGQIRGEQFFSERIRKGSHGGTEGKVWKTGELRPQTGTHDGREPSG